MSDDAIPTMAAAATADDGVGTRHIKFKEKVLHKITRSTDHIDEIKKHTSGDSSIKNRASTFQKMHDAQSPTVKERPKSTPRKSPISGGQGEKCPVCNKPVFAAERIVAEGRSYHKTCLRCGLGDKTIGCNKVLSVHDYEEYRKIMFCKACARKQHNEALASGSGFTGKGGPDLTKKTSTSSDEEIMRERR